MGVDNIETPVSVTKTTTIWLDQCVPGMRIAETITNAYMAIVVNAGTVLDDAIIEKLNNLNYQKVRIYTDTDKTIEYNSFETVKKEYREGVDTMKDVLRSLTSGKSLDMSTIAKVSGLMQTRRDDIVGLLSCLNQIRNADEYTYTHCLNVAFISQWIARWMKLDRKISDEIFEAGLLHDIGKCRVPSEILNKPAKLTKDEFEIMKKHTVFGYEILSATPTVLKSTSLTALEHHERTSGAGYPLGISDKRIHPFGKIAAVADIYDAMTSNRVYHKKSSPFEVFRMIEDMAFGSLDPSVVLTFLQNLAGYYIGDRVLLSDGHVGLVVFINPRSVSRPVVQTNDGIVNLDDSGHKNIVVSELL